MLTAIAAVSFMLRANADQVNLSRAYKEGQTASYKMTAHVNEGGQDADLVAQLTEKVKALREKGGADVQVEATELAMGGTDVGAQSPDPFKGDEHGMLIGSRFKDQEAVFAILGLCGYVPGKAVGVGESFPIDWKSDDFNANGSGSITEVKEVDGKKVAVVKCKVEVTPQGDTPATLEFTSEISIDTGMLLKSQGTAKSDQFEATFKVEPGK